MSQGWTIATVIIGHVIGLMQLFFAHTPLGPWFNTFTSRWVLQRPEIPAAPDPRGFLDALNDIRLNQIQQTEVLEEVVRLLEAISSAQKVTSDALLEMKVLSAKASAEMIDWQTGSISSSAREIVEAVTSGLDRTTLRSELLYAANSAVVRLLQDLPQSMSGVKSDSSRCHRRARSA